MLVASHVVVVKVNQGLDRLFHCRHLDQSHFTIPEKYDSVRWSQKSDFTAESPSVETCAFIGWGYLLEKLERFHSASSIGEEQPQVILCHILSVEMKDT